MTGLSNTRRRICSFLVMLVCVTALPARAQQTPQPTAVRPAAQDSARIIKPRTALLRSLLIPGWGQASVGAYTRGGVFFAAQGASWYMLLKTMAKLGDARDIEERRVAFVADTLRARMAIDTVLARQLADPVVFQQRVDSARTVVLARRLVDSRRQQRQDWITYTLFFTFASCVDAFVAAQLADFPAAIETRPRPAGGLELQVKVPLPRKP